MLSDQTKKLKLFLNTKKKNENTQLLDDTLFLFREKKGENVDLRKLRGNPEGPVLRMKKNGTVPEGSTPPHIHTHTTPGEGIEIIRNCEKKRRKW